MKTFAGLLTVVFSYRRRAPRLGPLLVVVCVLAVLAGARSLAAAIYRWAAARGLTCLDGCGSDGRAELADLADQRGFRS